MIISELSDDSLFHEHRRRYRERAPIHPLQRMLKVHDYKKSKKRFEIQIYRAFFESCRGVYRGLNGLPSVSVLYRYLLCRNHARQKTKRGDRYRIAMGPRALTASSGLAPWSMAVDRYFGSVKEKSNRSMGVKGALPPLGCLPLWGREGVTLAISTPAQKTRRRFLHSQKINSQRISRFSQENEILAKTLITDLYDPTKVFQSMIIFEDCKRSLFQSAGEVPGTCKFPIK